MCHNDGIGVHCHSFLDERFKPVLVHENWKVRPIFRIRVCLPQFHRNYRIHASSANRLSASLQICSTLSSRNHFRLALQWSINACSSTLITHKSCINYTYTIALTWGLFWFWSNSYSCCAYLDCRACTYVGHEKSSNRLAVDLFYLTAFDLYYCLNWLSVLMNGPVTELVANDCIHCKLWCCTKSNKETCAGALIFDKKNVGQGPHFSLPATSHRLSLSVKSVNLGLELKTNKMFSWIIAIWWLW